MQRTRFGHLKNIFTNVNKRLYPESNAIHSSDAIVNLSHVLPNAKEESDEESENTHHMASNTTLKERVLHSGYENGTSDQIWLQTIRSEY